VRPPHLSRRIFWQKVHELVGGLIAHTARVLIAPDHPFAHSERNRFPEEGTRVDEGMELPPFPARIHFSRKVIKKVLIVLFARSPRGEQASVGGDDNRLKPPLNEPPGKERGILPEDREESFHPDPGELFDPVVLDILKEDIPEGDRAYPLLLPEEKPFRHPPFVGFVGAVLRDGNKVHRDPQRRCLEGKEFPPNPVHRDPVIPLGDRYKKGEDRDSLLPQTEKGEGAVLSSAKGEENGWVIPQRKAQRE